MVARGERKNAHTRHVTPRHVTSQNHNTSTDWKLARVSIGHCTATTVPPEQKQQRRKSSQNLYNENLYTTIVRDVIGTERAFLLHHHAQCRNTARQKRFFGLLQPTLPPRSRGDARSTGLTDEMFIS